MENIELKARKDAYFQVMLIFKNHSFGKRLFSSHAYFQVCAYFRENTVDVFRSVFRLRFGFHSPIVGRILEKVLKQKGKNLYSLEIKGEILNQEKIQFLISCVSNFKHVVF